MRVVVLVLLLVLGLSVLASAQPWDPGLIFYSNNARVGLGLNQFTVKLTSQSPHSYVYAHVLASLSLTSGWKLPTAFGHAQQYCNLVPDPIFFLSLTSQKHVPPTSAMFVAWMYVEPFLDNRPNPEYPNYNDEIYLNIPVDGRLVGVEFYAQPLGGELEEKIKTVGAPVKFKIG
jgi:hypothetical protein